MKSINKHGLWIIRVTRGVLQERQVAQVVVSWQQIEIIRLNHH